MKISANSLGSIAARSDDEFGYMYSLAARSENEMRSALRLAN